ncbi:hypothetical protein CTI12_AA576730 [Artemisia annua]|uniref:Transmembrane protein n=1 Tax=Artemisia annua TaxID=35608 RepID=A0A2U1KQC8_ARTAN|nr:hypothetical protein CTI12_AA576730 [Artemisia annua]
MKYKRVSKLLITVFFAVILISHGTARTHPQTTTHTETHDKIGVVDVEARKLRQVYDDGSGCWQCWDGSVGREVVGLVMSDFGLLLVGYWVVVEVGVKGCWVNPCEHWV